MAITRLFNNLSGTLTLHSALSCPVLTDDKDCLPLPSPPPGTLRCVSSYLDSFNVLKETSEYTFSAPNHRFFNGILKLALKK